jgi:nitroreductase
METKNLVDSIFKRRSVRKYIEKEVEAEKITLLLKVAMSAPTAANRQPWEFIVVNDSEKLFVVQKVVCYQREMTLLMHNGLQSQKLSF